jgi:hypothetical protein
MPGGTVRVRKETQTVLRELAVSEGKPMQTILDVAYATLRNNPEAWKAELAERKEWDATMADGQEDK